MVLEDLRVGADAMIRAEPGGPAQSRSSAE
jgi:hypothetical protein